MAEMDLRNMDCMELMAEFHFELANWVSVEDFPHYFISSDGRVFNERTGKLKKSCLDYKGYSRIRLIDGRKKGATKKIHRLVAKAFLSDYSESLQVNHKNCIKNDNRVENLEMVTQSQNTKHAWENGRMKLTKRNSKGVFVRCKTALK